MLPKLDGQPDIVGSNMKKIPSSDKAKTMVFIAYENTKTRMEKGKTEKL